MLALLVSLPAALAVPAVADGPGRGIGHGLIRHSAPGGGKPQSAQQVYSASYALVVGIDNYTKGWPRLKNAGRDADLVAKQLRDTGFDVTVRKNLGGEELRRVLREFFAVKGLDPDARLLFWYAGHGYTMSRAGAAPEGFLVAGDTPRPTDEAAFKVSALHMREFGNLMRLAQAKHILAIFDSCFAGTIFRMSDSKPGAETGMDMLLPVREFITAGAENQSVLDDGRFRDEFLMALQGRRDGSGEAEAAASDGLLTATELGGILSRRMKELTGGRQTPQFGRMTDPDLSRGEFLFFTPTPPPTPESSGPVLAGGSQSGASLPDNRSLPELGGLSDPVPAPGPAKPPQVAMVPPPPPPAVDLSPVLEGGAHEMVVIRSASLRAAPEADALKTGLLRLKSRVTVAGQVRGSDWFRIDRDGTPLGYVERAVLRDPALVQPPRRPGGPQALRDCPECPELAVVPAGTGQIGADNGRGDEQPVRDVKFDRPFAIGRREVTVGQFRAFITESHYTVRQRDCGTGGGSWENPGFAQTDEHPVVCLSWRDMQAYTAWLGNKTGQRYRLPTEREWEYAARGGTRTVYAWGDEFQPRLADCKGCGSNWDGQGTAPAGSFAPNGFGLYDMAGNAAEWLATCYDPHAYWNFSPQQVGAERDAPLDDCPDGRRVVRGGSWAADATRIRPAARDHHFAGFGTNDIGFRVVREIR